MKTEKTLKKVLIILFIILISLISFGGIFVQDTKFVKNIIPEYQLGTDLTGSTIVEFKVNDATNTVIYDKEGNVVDEEGEETVEKEEPINPEEILTEENYLLTKQIFEKRLKSMSVTDYTLRFDEKSGKAVLQLPANSDTSLIAQYTAIKGEFTVVNEDNEILLNNSHLKKAQVGYTNTESGTVIYLNIQFNKEGTQILKDITNTYIKTTDEEGNEQTKKVTFKMDDTTILTTYFEEEIANGTVQFSMGATTSNKELNEYIRETSNLAMLLNTGNLPISYTIEDMYYMMSDITEEMFLIPTIIVGALIIIGIIFLIVKYKKNGLLASVCFIGYIAALLLILRYTNVVINLTGIAGIIVSILLNYVFTVYLLNSYKKEESKILVQALFVLIPATIISVILSFAKWLNIYSFGMVTFWGILIAIIYNFIITKNLIELSNKNN
ncbi:MAG: hypothetical protein ACI4UU_01875 [Clostridia bacterium]